MPSNSFETNVSPPESAGFRQKETRQASLPGTGSEKTINPC
jgi:hypothetical protein